MIVIDFEIDFEFGEAGSRTLELATYFFFVREISICPGSIASGTKEMHVFILDSQSRLRNRDKKQL